MFSDDASAHSLHMRLDNDISGSDMQGKSQWDVPWTGTGTAYRTRQINSNKSA
jgi:hypothetical protein